jgi:HD-GYP domain-containing protein (c-di-GMP phosphodiesterase class II)
MDNYVLYVGALLAFIIVLLLASNFVKSRKVKKMTVENDLIGGILRFMDSEETLDTRFTNLLVVISKIIKCDSYALYLRDEKNRNFTMKCVRQSVSGEMKIVPSYSGLAPFKKETFVLPNTVRLDFMESRASVTKVGEVSLVQIPFRNKDVLILAGPAKRVSSADLALLNEVEVNASDMMTTVLELERLRVQANQNVISEKATKMISGLVTKYGNTLDLVLKSCVFALGARGGFLISGYENDLNLEVVSGLKSESEARLRENPTLLKMFLRCAVDDKYIGVSSRDQHFSEFKKCLPEEEMDFILIHKIGNSKTVVVFTFPSKPVLNEYQITALHEFMKSMHDIIKNHENFKKISNSNLELLKMLANLIDDMKPSTIGYSQLMYRYAVIIAKKMKLSPAETNDIAMAALLSNIGVIGLSDDLFNTTGQYTELESETIRLHSEVGACLVETVTGNANAADYIRHHHERYDGHGYPSGLGGNDIPLGSRIIAVVQTFLAKVSSRDYRDAVPFATALEQLKTATGTQLDLNVVQALTGWFKEKQKECAGYDAALGPCWEMRISSKKVCSECPAYQNSSQHCWEIPGVNCSAHGNRCDTCFIKSEYLSRRKRV